MFQVKQRDRSQGDQSLGTQWGQFSVPHFCIVGGVGKPASSQRLLSTFCVVLCRRTIQCAALTWQKDNKHHQHIQLRIFQLIKKHKTNLEAISTTWLWALRPVCYHPVKLEIFWSTCKEHAIPLKYYSQILKPEQNKIFQRLCKLKRDLINLRA